jgi:hypothetical protein
VAGIAGTANTLDDLNDLDAAGVRNAVIADGDGTQINAANLNTLSGHAPGSTIAAASDIPAMRGTDDALLAASAPANFGDLAITETTGYVTAGTVGDKTDYALTAAYDDAKTAAQAGDDMGLTSGAVTAIWDALTSALTTAGSIGKLLVDNINATISSRSTLTEAEVQAIIDEIKGGTWSDETLVAIKAVLDTAAADVANIDGEAMRGTDGASTFDAANETVDVGAVAGSAVTGPADLKADVSALALEATLEAMQGAGWTDETLVAIKDAIDGLSLGGGDASEANQTTIIDHLTDIKGGTWSDETLVALKTLLDALPTAAEIDTELTSSHGSGAWTSGSAGSGANTVTVTASDGAGTLANNVKLTMQDSEGNTVGVLTTDSLGVATFYLDDGTYTLVSATTTSWVGESNEETVSGDTDIALTLTAQTLPTPSSADKYTIIINAADEHDTLVGSAERSYKITSIYPAHDPSANLVRSTERNAITTDANGQASFEVGKNVTGGTLLESYTDEDSVTRTVERRFVVDADEADAEGRIYLADIEV